MSEERFRLNIGALAPAWFWQAIETGQITPQPMPRLGQMNDWGQDGAMVGEAHARIGDVIERQADGTFIVHPADA